MIRRHIKKPKVSFEIWIDRTELFYVTAWHQILPILRSAKYKLAICSSCYVHSQIL